MQQFFSQQLQWTVIGAWSIVCLLSAQQSYALTVRAATESQMVVSNALDASEVKAGKTIQTPNTRFHLGVPPKTVRKAPATVSIHTSPRAAVRKGKRKLKTKRIFTYTIDKQIDGPVWIQVRNGTLKKTDTLKYYNKSTGKWKKIPSRVRLKQHIIQGQLNKRTATIGVFQRRKRQRRTNAQQGQASWYVVGGKQLTAAHRTFPFGTTVRVTNVANGRAVDVVIDDRGPFIKGRVVDLSKFAFRQLADPSMGVLDVKVTVQSRP